MPNQFECITAPRATTILYKLIKTLPSGAWILPANICPIVVAALYKSENPFLFIDIDPHTLNLSSIDCLNLIKKYNKIVGIILNQTYGGNFDYSTLSATIKTTHPNIYIIEDRCLCEPDIHNRSPNPFADCILYSLGQKKYADCSSGAFAWIKKETNPHPLPPDPHPYNPDHFNQIESTWKSHNKPAFIHLSKTSAWLPPYQPTPINWEKLQHKIDQIKSHKLQLNQIYRDRLPKEIQLQDSFQQWRFNILINNPDYLLQELLNKHLFASRLYPPLTYLDNQNHAYPNAAHIHSKIINLFNDHYYNKEMAIKTTQIILKHLSKNKT